MGDVINLNRFRKQKAVAKARNAADVNAAARGRTRAERDAAARAAARLRQQVDDARREPVEQDPQGSDPGAPEFEDN